MTISPNVFRVQIIEKLIIANRRVQELHDVLDSKEKEWIWKMNIVAPNRLNEGDSFSRRIRNLEYPTKVFQLV